MKFIKLTLKDGRDVFVFIDKLTDIIRKEKSEGSFVSYVGNDGISVTESPEEILQKIEEVSVEFELIEGVEVKTEEPLTDVEEIERIFNLMGVQFQGWKSPVGDNYIEISDRRKGQTAQFIFRNQKFYHFGIYKK